MSIKCAEGSRQPSDSRNHPVVGLSHQSNLSQAARRNVRLDQGAGRPREDQSLRARQGRCVVTFAGGRNLIRISKLLENWTSRDMRPTLHPSRHPARTEAAGKHPRSFTPALTKPDNLWHVSAGVPRRRDQCRRGRPQDLRAAEEVRNFGFLCRCLHAPCCLHFAARFCARDHANHSRSSPSPTRGDMVRQCEVSRRRSQRRTSSTACRTSLRPCHIVAKLRRRKTRLMLLQRADDLLAGKP
jgi:hypothetical protein